MTKTLSIFKTIYPNFVWEVKNSNKVIYLTFDDGPIPFVTEFVLDQLAIYNAKATFFCVGQNVKNNPDIFHKVVNAGHIVGNHTNDHLNGWKTQSQDYISNFELCDHKLKQQNITSNLFRPPYGLIKISQAKQILKTHKIIMWSVLSKDYDEKYDAFKCLNNTIKATKAGSIVLFHDSLKAQKNLFYVLPKFLKHFNDLGYKFISL
jgi:peptidoglycan-N-acetylglucosamine deacetylase